MAQKYQRRIPAYDAEQFHVASQPYPPDVDDCGEIEGPHLHMAGDNLLPMHDGDWVLTDVRTHAVMMVTDATFQADYELHTGPTGELIDGDESVKGE